RPETYLIEVHYRSPNPELASAIANAAAHTFVQQGFQNRSQGAAELTRWLNIQLDTLRASLERAQQKLTAFEKEHNVVNPEDRTNILNVQLQELQEAHSTAQAERLRKETAYRTLESGGMESLVISEQGDPLMKLAEKLEGLETALAEAAEHYGPNHYVIKRQEAQIARTKALLETTKQKVIKRIKADYEQALAREKALNDAAAEQKEELNRLSARAVEYGILKRDAESQAKLYDELLKKVNEASINASIKATNLRLAGLALPPTAPVYPRVKMYVLLALLLSTTAAVGLALAADYLDRTLQSSEQVEQWLSVPVLANLPRVRGKNVPAVLMGATEGEESRSLVKSGGAFLEALGMLRTSVLLAGPSHDVNMVLVASAAPSEGKS